MTTNPQALAMVEGAPVLYPVLRAVFHLEALEPDDAERIEEANAIVSEWLGDQFGISWFSFWNEVEGFRRTDLEYASQYATSLATEVGAEEWETNLLQNAGKHSRDEFNVTLSGSKVPSQGSPIMYDFWAEIPEVGFGDQYRALAMLSVSVPIDWPLQDFYDRVNAISNCLRLRWGAAGYSYAEWILYDYQTAFDHKYAHARRYHCFDVAQYVHLAERWHDEIRSVDWLTWVGPALVEKLSAAGVALDSSTLLTVTRVADTVRIEAGKAPEAGDINRLQVPIAYVAADRLVRPVRARTGVDFGGRWTEATTAGWLSRFETA